jgi:hypothetical protein
MKHGNLHRKKGTHHVPVTIKTVATKTCPEIGDHLCAQE